MAGVWSPLAAATVVQWLVVLVRMLGDDATRSKVKVPKTSELLKSWCLPCMGAALVEEEDDAQRREEDERLEAFAKQFGKKVERVEKK